VKEEEKQTLTRSISEQILAGHTPSEADMASLIKGLCEEYREVSKRGIAPCRAHDLETAE
jgi:hypothetical protein